MPAACYTFLMRSILPLGFYAVLGFLVAAPPSPPQSAPSSPPHTPTEFPLLRQFEDKYRHATRLQANFLERYSENGRLIRTEAGRAYFLHPGKMRWDYESPEKNIFLVDGKYAWFYSPADHIATRIPTKKSEDWRTPLAFLTSDMKLARICSQIDAAHTLPAAQPDNSVFRCLLRGSPDQATLPRHLLFEVSLQGDLSRIVIPQEGGIELEFSFKDWQWNPPLSKDWFLFTPPAGVVIVDGLLPSSPTARQ